MRISRDQIIETLVQGGGAVIKRLISQTLEEGMSPYDILHEALMPAMSEVGRRMQAGEYYIPEVLISARTAQMALEVLRPHLAASESKSLGTVVLGTVQGDLHDIGKNLVGMMLEGSGFTVIDLGVDVLPERFVSMAREHNAQLIGMSALITTTMVRMKEALEVFRETGLIPGTKVLVGGAPLTQRYAAEIGADGYAPDAASAVEEAMRLIGTRRAHS